MDELIGRLVADIGIDRAAAEKAVGIILDFLVKEGPADKVQPLLAKLPGAEGLMQKAASESGGGLLGGAMGGVMGAGMRMMSAGLSMGQVQSVTRRSSRMRVRKSARMQSAKSSPLFPVWRSLFEYERSCRDDIAD